jgi:hypothetical protein
MPELTSADLANFESIKDYLEQVLVSGPLPYLLYPFRLVVRPYLAADGLAFLSAVGRAAAVGGPLFLGDPFRRVFRRRRLRRRRSWLKSRAARAGNWQAAGEIQT